MRLRSTSLRRYRKVAPALAVLGVLIYLSAKVCRLDLSGFGEGLVEGFKGFRGILSPDWGAFPSLVKPALQSVAIALVGTVLGTILSLFFGLAAASNVSPLWLRRLTRLLLGMERSMPEIIIILILVAAFGMGPFGGALTLTVGCIGMLGKLTADAIEELDSQSIESIEAVGATKLQVLFYGIFQQIVPRIISFALFRFEMSIRLSVILGAVGAGGIGFELFRAFNLLEYSRFTSALLFTAALVLGAERLSGYLRLRFKSKGGLA